MAKEQLAVIEMITNMILGKTDGVSKVDFTPQKIPFPENLPYEQAFLRATPESQGVSSEKLRHLLSNLSASPYTDMHHFLVLRHGNVICDCSFAPYRSGIWHISHSMCKSITSMAIGLLIDEGKLSLDENIYNIFPFKIFLHRFHLFHSHFARTAPSRPKIDQNHLTLKFRNDGIK